MKNDSFVRFRYLRFWGFAIAVGVAICAGQTRALEQRENQVQIEPRFLQVSQNHLSQIGVDFLFDTKYPGFGNPLTSHFQPIAVMPRIDVSRLISQIEKGGQSHVTTGPTVTAEPNETAHIPLENGVVLTVIPVVNDDGSIGMKMAPELTLVQPGSTLLVGRTIPGQNRDELVFLEPHLISGLAPRRTREAIGPLTEHALVSSAFNWTGFYIGGQVGYARSQSDYSLKLGGEWEMFPSHAEEIEDEGDHEFDEDGYGIGGCAGFNYEFRNHVVIGFGIAGRKYWNLSNTFETGDFPAGPIDAEFDVWSSFNTTGLVTVGPKLGYAFGRILPYVSGGLAFGELDASQKIFSNEFNGFREGEKASEQRLGWNISAGVQYAFTNNWSLRVEYSYSDLGTFKYPGKTEPNFLRDFTTWHMATLTEHGGNFGIVYTFGRTTSASSH
jgi:outer membrane immunogenic protein